PLELGVRALQRRARINAQLASEIHYGEQDIANLVFDRFSFPLFRFPIQFSQFLFDLGAWSARIRPVEPHVRGALLDPESGDQRVLVPWRHAFLRECNRFIVLHLASGPGIIPAPGSVSTSARDARAGIEVELAA